MHQKTPPDPFLFTTTLMYTGVPIVVYWGHVVFSGPLERHGVHTEKSMYTKQVSENERKHSGAICHVKCRCECGPFPNFIHANIYAEAQPKPHP